MNELAIGVIGVLEGRGPGSIDNTGKLLILDRVACSPVPLAWDIDIDDRRLEVLLPVGWTLGTLGKRKLTLSISLSSSMEGKLCATSEMEDANKDRRGDDESEDVGDGGPRDEGGTTACGEDVAELDAEDAVLSEAEGRLGRVVFNREGEGVIPGGSSREKRFVAGSTTPFWPSIFNRSATKFPTLTLRRSSC